MEKLRRITGVIDVFVFVATTLAIAGVFYEGMTLKWYGFVGILVVCMDYSFLPATILHLILDRKEKQIRFHLFSMGMLLTAIIMKIAGLDYPAVTLVFWYFYIWFLYGWLNIRRLRERCKASAGEQPLSGTVRFDPETQVAIIRSSICTGEKVAGFKNKTDGRFTEVMLIRDPDDEKRFREQYGLDTVKVEY